MTSSIKISELPAATTPLSGAELVPLTQAGVTKQATVTQIAAYTSNTTSLLNGGAAAASTLTLQSTSGVGTSDAVIFKTGSQVERMRIDTSGNVGIGTSSPSSILEVASASLATTLNATQTNASLFFRTDVSNSDKLVFKATRFAAGSDWTYANLTLGRAIAGATSGFPTVTFGNNSAGTFDPMLELSVGSALLRMTNSGNVGIGTTSPSQLLDVNSDSIRVRTAKTPASASATGTQGQIAWDASYIYVCTATNTWKRVALATW
jgi:hypothetical protein